MTKKEYCLENPVVGYYNSFGGLEIHGIEHSIDDYMYCVSGAWVGRKKYHKLKLHVDKDDIFALLHGILIPLGECMVL